MFGISTEWWMLYTLIVVMASIALRIFMNGFRILVAELREIRRSVKELDGPGVLRELKAIRYVTEGLESDYGGFELKEKIESVAQQE